MALEGKYALITGSSRGIGRGIALKLTESGVNVGVHYYQNEAAANDTLARVRQKGADGFVVQALITGSSRGIGRGIALKLAESRLVFRLSLGMAPTAGLTSPTTRDLEKSLRFQHVHSNNLC